MLFIEELSQKQFYTIKDVCKVTNKKSDTIRSWERKGIIHKPKETMYSVGFCNAGWRKSLRLPRAYTARRMGRGYFEALP